MLGSKWVMGTLGFDWIGSLNKSMSGVGTQPGIKAFQSLIGNNHSPLALAA